jgi:restriction endonuclease S subunit
MQTSTIKFSQIEDRIDAEYYKPEYLNISSILKRDSKLGEFIKIKNGYPFDSTLFGYGNLPVVRIRDFTETGINFSELTTVPSYYAEENGYVFPCAGEILVGMDGLNEFRAYLISSEEETKIAINQRIAIVKAIKKLFPEYIYIFLNSKLGQNQLLREMTTAGTVGHISNEIIKSIRIPIPSLSFQQKIEKMVKEAQEKRKVADEKYKEAENILNKELGLENLDLSTQKTFEAKFSETEDRFDPEYYKPIYKKIYKSLKNISKPITEICKVVKTKISPQSSPEKMFHYIEIGGINNSTGEVEKVLNLHGWQVPSGSKYIVKNNDVLLSAVRTYLKGIALIDKECEGSIATTGFHIFRNPIINPEVLFLFLRSHFGLMQFEKFFLGSTYPVIKSYDLKNILIPILPKSTQQKISSLIQESFRLRKEAKELIEQAKKEVEDMVENR